MQVHALRPLLSGPQVLRQGGSFVQAPLSLTPDGHWGTPPNPPKPPGPPLVPPPPVAPPDPPLPNVPPWPVTNPPPVPPLPPVVPAIPLDGLFWHSQGS